MTTVKATAHMASPIIQSSPLHLDGLMTAVHPSMHNLDRQPKRTDTTRQGLKPCPLPLASAYFGGSWVWAASAAEYSDDAELRSSTIAKSTDGKDILYLQRQITTSSGPMKDRIVTNAAIVAAEVYFFALTPDEKEFTRIVNRIRSIGGLRKSGYGEVRSWEIKPIDIDPKEILAVNGTARRNLPNSLCQNKSIQKVIINPPYWLWADAPEGFTVGNPVVLGEVKFR